MIRAWVATSAAAAQLGVDKATLKRWVKDGCPHRTRGRGYQFPLTSVRKWMEETGRAEDTGGTSMLASRMMRGEAVTGEAIREKVPGLLESVSADDLSRLTDAELARVYSEAKARKERAQAGKAELEEAARRGDLVARDDVRGIIAKMASSVKAAALAVPGRVGKKVATMTTRDAELELEREMRGLLSALAESVGEMA